jgi:2-polyprenyl-3-methyl-5-hydroxy-6-metoxy-1,4-benzoquinol methylase
MTPERVVAAAQMRAGGSSLAHIAKVLGVGRSSSARTGGIDHATLLGAGCGTGRHAAAFAALGHQVTLLDASAELPATAASR